MLMILREIGNSILIYAGLMLLIRLMGKRQLGEMELSELVVTILISEVAARPIVEEHATLLGALVPAVTLMGLEVLLSVVSLKNVRLRGILSGKPSLLVVRGRIDQAQMRKNRITPDELAEALRDDGLLDLRDVQYAVLETSGKIPHAGKAALHRRAGGRGGVRSGLARHRHQRGQGPDGQPAPSGPGRKLAPKAAEAKRPYHAGAGVYDDRRQSGRDLSRADGKRQLGVLGLVPQELRQLLHEGVDILELAIHRGEADIGHLTDP